MERSAHECNVGAAAVPRETGEEAARLPPAAGRLGHKDVRTTLQLYGHLFPEQDDLLTDSMERLYQQCDAPPRHEGTIDTDNVSGKNDSVLLISGGTRSAA